MSVHALIIGAGSTGCAVAHDLALRGYRVTVVERGEIASETTGRNHGLLHSGGRYAMTDPEAAKECAEENALMRKLMPDLLERNGGLFVALTEEDMGYLERFLEGCANAGIPTQQLTPKQALELEPNLNPKLLAAVSVPDGVFDPFHFSMAFLATAKLNGAVVYPYTEVREFVWSGRTITGVKVLDRSTGKEKVLGADIFINAAGPWGAKVAQMAGVKHVAMVPTAGIMVAVHKRWTQRVINRLNRPGDGDIIVPQRRNAVIGTTSWVIQDPDNIPIPPEQIKQMLDCGELLVPGFSTAPLRGISAAARPLLDKTVGGGKVEGRELTRGFDCFNHAPDGAEGLFSILGGKTTTARAMAEKLGDILAGVTGITTPCRTKEVPLASYRAYYRS